MQITQYPKQKPFRSKKAREWFRTQKCMICMVTNYYPYDPIEYGGQVTGHHEPLSGHGIASKGPDNEQIPMCFNHHKSRHNKGRDTFYKSLGIPNWRNLVELYKELVDEYLSGLKKK